MEPGTPTPPSSPPSLVWVVVLMGVLVLAVQVILLFLVLDTRSAVGSVSDDVRDVELRLAGDAGGDVGSPVAAPTSSTTAPATTAPAATAPPPTASPGTTQPSPIDELPSTPAPEFDTEATGLPRFGSNSEDDPAIGTQLGSLGAVEWEAGTEVVFDLADGTARAIVVWAHWCEPCREMLPQLDEWQAGPGAELENVELVTVASAVDEDPEVTLSEYLSEQAFSFPVLIDSDNELAARIGVDAFPFWVFVSPGGGVIGRVSGQLPPDQFSSLFLDLQDVAAQG